jgi:SAM-dependent methyltransferase
MTVALSSTTGFAADPAPAGRCPGCGATPRQAPADRVACHACATIWLPSRLGYRYGDHYPDRRGHHEADIARRKLITLGSWLRRMAIPVTGRRVLEVGFGGGATLAWLKAHGAEVAGHEPVAANRSAAIRLGIAPENVSAELDRFANRQFDLLLYLDSFEHVPDPRHHLRAVSGMAVPGALAMVVLPVADSLSRHVLGRFWPHDLDDHWVFYSSAGLETLWRAHGWRLASRFFPWKYLSLQTVARHWRIKTGLPMPFGPLAQAGIWLNFGERGFVFERVAGS